MNTPATPRLGLRERKKIKLRQTVQLEALRLFEKQGYEPTTVEQIAEAAETSTTTFYRYFPTKEDVVLTDDYDPLIMELAKNRPAGEPLVDTLRVIIAAVAANAEADRDRTLARMRLVATVPALDARYAGEERKTIDLFVALLAERAGRPADDFDLVLVASAVVAVLGTAARRWSGDNGTGPLGERLNQAVDVIEPLLARI